MRTRNQQIGAGHTDKPYYALPYCSPYRAVIAQKQQVIERKEIMHVI